MRLPDGLIRSNFFIGISLLLLPGCASPRVQNVTQLMQTYKVGVTTFDDFKRDAKLVEVQDFSTIDPQYLTLNGSTFEIINQFPEFDRYNQNIETGQSFGIGDASGKRCYLVFEIRSRKLVEMTQ